MKSISSLVLNQKQKLSLIQVGSEKILLAISPEQVNFITHVPTENNISKGISQESQVSEQKGIIQGPLLTNNSLSKRIMKVNQKSYLPSNNHSLIK